MSRYNAVTGKKIRIGLSDADFCCEVFRAVESVAAALVVEVYVEQLLGGDE